MTGPCIDGALLAQADSVMRTLRARKLSVVTAESCTAGLIAAALSQADGASEHLHGSFVVYTKDNKAKALGVPSALLAERGSVNDDVAKHMACGALERSPADIALAVTGVLGPDEDEDGNPVGLAFISACRRGRDVEIVRKDYGKHHDDDLRHRVVCDALEWLRQCAEADA